MASTNIAAAVVRTITTQYLAAEMPSANQLIASGAVDVDANPPFFSATLPQAGAGALPGMLSANGSGGGATVVIPEHLEITGADGAIPDDDTELTLVTMATSSDTGVVVRREKNISVKDSAVVASAENFNAEFARQVPQYWANRIGAALYSCLTGAFTTSGVLNTDAWRLDVGGPFSRSSIPDVMKATSMRDQWPLFRVWIMSGVQFAQAFADGIVQYVEAGAFGERLLTSGEIPTIAGKQVVVDDTIPDADGTTYLCKPGALYVGFQTNLVLETARDAGKGGGMWKHYIRQHYVPHVRRLVYAGAANPANTVLDDAASWTLSTAASTDPKLVKVFKVKFTN